MLRRLDIFALLAVVAQAAFAPCFVTAAQTRGVTRASAPQHVGYLFLHFYDNYTSPGNYTTYPAGEQVFGHISNGNNPLSYHALKHGAPLLTSTVGTRGVRDLFLASRPDETRHYVIATDLNQTAVGGFRGRFLSRSLVVWESKGASLTQWHAPRLVEVVPPNFRMAWAPEAVWDYSRGQFMVFWASSKYREAKHTGLPDSDKIYRAFTSDFKKFTPAELYYERPNNVGVIDMTIHATGNSSRPKEYVRFQKSEDVLRCFGEVSSSGLDGPWKRIGHAKSFVNIDYSPGEACLAFSSNTNAAEWFVFVDEYGRRNPPGYYPYLATNGITKDGYKNIGLGKLPRLVKHGTVKKVTQAQYDEIKAKWG